MQDKLGRRIDYLRVSVTDRCNLRCFYCMPEDGVPLVDRGRILTLEEFARLIEAATTAGVRRVRFTGGEPLLRKGLPGLIRTVAGLRADLDIALTTNGVLLAGMAGELKAAGLARVNISLDTLRPERYAAITRGGDLDRVWRGIEAALAEGLAPVKINTVLVRGVNDDEVEDLARLTLDRALHVRFIELMPIRFAAGWAPDRLVTAAVIREKLAGWGDWEPAHPPAGGGPARYFRLPGAQGTVGFIPALSDHFCGSCNRLRLTATGALRPCLYHAAETDVRELVRGGASIAELADVIRIAAAGKPSGHRLDGGWRDQRSMSQLGG
ncbi:MAG: GTP 3',8-cyclase MoaA [Peptococcaceae bacterium]|nr:GTP 3',8-cyclase MoaA [Peptococcaceae bacterium]